MHYNFNNNTLINIIATNFIFKRKNNKRLILKNFTEKLNFLKIYLKKKN